MRQLQAALATYGIPPQQVQVLHSNTLSEASQLEYQDLVSLITAVEAVVEYDGQPVLYVLRQNQLSASPKQQDDLLGRILSQLACRGGTTYLAVISTGMLKVYPCVLRTGQSLPQPLIVQEHPDSAPNFFQKLVQGSVDLEFKGAKGKDVHQVLLRAIRNVSENLEKSAAFESRSDEARFLEVLALTGRALFARFLADREILSAKTFALLQTVEAGDLLSTPEAAAATFSWLDQTFNGDLLPVAAAGGDYLAYMTALHKTDRTLLGRLSQIMRHSEDGQIPLWQFVDFAHVPVGLLSEVYEEFAHRRFKGPARSQSVHYTPRHLAELVVNQTLSGLRPDHVAEARVLDPAVGAGVFLVLAFKRLVVARWQATKRRPTTEEIRDILYTQLRGIDINEPALLLAALSLYLTAIELDADPFPPDKLRFPRSLMDEVLLLVNDEQKLGSLGKTADGLIGYADIVLGNPPWTAVSGDKAGFTVNANRIAQRVIAKRFSDEDAPEYHNPDNVPDLPFLWRSMEFCKPQGLIALMMHGRLLFTQRDVEARNTVFATVRVTGIVNCALLSDSPLVWPKVDAPFMILFARNERPGPDALFHFVTPFEEPDLHRQGRIRIDPFQAVSVSPEMLRDAPTLLKTLTRGTSLDTQIIDKLRRLSGQVDGLSEAMAIGEYWKKLQLHSGEGFIVNGPNQKDCQPLRDLKGYVLDSASARGFLVDIEADQLRKFSHTTLYRQARPEIYQPPLVIVSESPGQQRTTPKARLALRRPPIIYSKSYMGLSCHGHPHAETLAKYLFVVLNSVLPLYYQLMTSSKFGIERRVILAADVLSFPVFPPETVPAELLRRIEDVADELIERNTTSWDALDDLVFDLYGLTKVDREVIRDSLMMASPWRHGAEKAMMPPAAKTLKTFADRIQRNLRGLLEDDHLVVQPPTWSQKDSAWRFLEVLSNASSEEIEPPQLMREVAQVLADQEGASVILMPLHQGRLIFGMLAQSRYWTVSRARLMTHEIVNTWDTMLQQSRAALPDVSH